MLVEVTHCQTTSDFSCQGYIENYVILSTLQDYSRHLGSMLVISHLGCHQSRYTVATYMAML